MKRTLVVSSDTPWTKLVARYQEKVGKPICNCRQAYETVCPGSSSDKPRTCNGCFAPNGHTFCDGGCSATQIHAREEIAILVLEELGEL